MSESQHIHFCLLWMLQTSFVHRYEMSFYTLVVLRYLEKSDSVKICKIFEAGAVCLFYTVSEILL